MKIRARIEGGQIEDSVSPMLLLEISMLTQELDGQPYMTIYELAEYLKLGSRISIIVDDKTPSSSYEESMKDDLVR